MPLPCDLQFPSGLRAIIKDIATSVVQDENEYLETCQYPEIIERGGGLELFVDHAVSAIDMEMLGLQGKSITVQQCVIPRLHTCSTAKLTI